MDTIQEHRYVQASVSDDADIEKHSSNKNTVVLPPELERSIFEMATLNIEAGRPDAAKILLVAKYVHDWVKPLLYRYLHIRGRALTFPKVNFAFEGGDMTLPTIEAIGPFVRHLLITAFSLETANLLKHCSGLISLAMWFTPAEMDWTIPTPSTLRMLSVGFEKLQKDQLLQCQHIFYNLTHLEIIHSPSEEQWCTIQGLPRLTHLSFHTPVTHKRVLRILQGCTNLRLLLILIQNGDSLYKTYESGNTINDPRLVLGALSSWGIKDYATAWSKGGVDSVWTYYERFTIARKRGYVLPSVPHLFQLPFPDPYFPRVNHTRPIFNWDDYLTEEGKNWLRGLSW